MLAVFFTGSGDMIRYDTAYCSILGARKDQQDSYKVLVQEDISFAVVCDGLGGHKGGALASGLAVDMLTRSFNEQRPEDIALFLADNARKINEAVYDLRCEDGSRMGAGSTIVCAIIEHNRLYRLSIGDSRIYLFRDSQLMQITVDHNYFMLLDHSLKSGRITQEEYEQECYKGNSLISVLGMEQPGMVDINTKPLELQDGDIVILMSDGLYKALDDEEIADCLQGDAKNCCERITERLQLVSQDSLDNTTFIIERITEEKSDG